MRLYRLVTGSYVNLDMVSYIDLFDTYADIYVSGRYTAIHLSDDDFARLVQWLRATADATNQPFTKNRTNPAAMPNVSPTMINATTTPTNEG